MEVTCRYYRKIKPSSVLTVEKCEEMLSIFKKVANSSNKDLSENHQLRLKWIIEFGEEKDWKTFIGRIIEEGKKGYGEEIENEVEQFLSIIDQAMDEPSRMNIKLTLRCITIRDAEVSLEAQWKGHPFFQEKTLAERTIVGIPYGYHANQHRIKTRRPFGDQWLYNVTVWGGYIPHPTLLDLIYTYQQEHNLPSLTPLSTLYATPDNTHTLTYTSYRHKAKASSIRDQFLPLFNQICEFLEGTPKEAVIIQDRNKHGECVLVYPDGKYIPYDEYPVVEP